jgi:uncharacterized NAD(P)/FAD-binding protein YdhS
MRPASIAIVGMGPRGLSILERIVSTARFRRSVVPLEIHVIDPGECGQGVHASTQPRHLLINTIANQVTMFPDGSALAVPPGDGPSLTEWAREAGYRRYADGYFTVGEGVSEEIGEHDYLPRALLGEYLTWVFDRLVETLPPLVRLQHHRDVAVDVEPRDGERFAVQLSRGATVESDYVFLTTGHCGRKPTATDRDFDDFVCSHARLNRDLAYHATAYPVRKLSATAGGATVLVQGLGLTGYDVISELTAGKGGRFERDGERLAYVPSGREPRILLTSRNCLPFASRGTNQKGINGQYKAKFFTKEAVRSLRARASVARGTPQLDFEREVLPLLVRELGYAYRTTRDGIDIPPDRYELGDDESAIIAGVFDPLAGKTFENLAAYRRFFIDQVESDLEQAKLGNVTSPVKAMTDVLRDTREALRAAVEFRGLTPESHRTFVSRYVPLMNRIAFGPPKQRNIELLALFEAGVVDLAGGPNPAISKDASTARFSIESRFSAGVERRFADVLAVARLDPFVPEEDPSALTQALLRRGIVRPFYNGSYHPGGIDIDESNRPIGRGGFPTTNVWAVGYPVEGQHFYTYALPRPLLGSRQLQDADTCVSAVFDALADRWPVLEKTTVPA